MPDIKIYIAAPSNYYSGGPELLHQLCFKLRQHGYDAIMWYYNVIEGNNGIHPHFRHYNNPVRKFGDVCDVSRGHCVLPEVIVSKTVIDALDNLGVQSIPWWLSVDNYCGLRGLPSDSDPDVGGLKYRQDIVHLVQSNYAMWFLREKMRIPETIGAYYLKDYLRKEFFPEEEQDFFSSKARLPIVLFNPSKGLEYIKKLHTCAQSRYAMGTMNWIPLVGMTPTQVMTAMRAARLYVDFGHHPGMDRIPREAASCGCCVITNRRGSAGFYEDVPIPGLYKCDDSDENIPEIVSLMGDIMQNYDEHVGNFSHYRDFIRLQEKQFEVDALRVFTEIVGPPVGALQR